MDLALNLVDQYLGFVDSLAVGRQRARVDPAMRDHLRDAHRRCASAACRRVAARRTHQLRQTAAWTSPCPCGGVVLEKAVGMRLTFRQPPPIRCFSNQFLFYLNYSVAGSAFEHWASMSPDPVSALPPERFTFDVVNMSLQ